MSAVVGVLNENLIESIKGFYKLRKAYVALDYILNAEHRYIQTLKETSLASTQRNSCSTLASAKPADTANNMPGSFGDVGDEKGVIRNMLQCPKVDKADESGGLGLVGADTMDDSDDEKEFVDAAESLGLPQMQSGNSTYDAVDETQDSLASNAPSTPTFSEPLSPPTLLHSPTKGIEHIIEHDLDSDLFSNPIDIFIHSGANLCFGLLLLIISLIPPAFAKLLLIIGFRGDRERGIRMLWQSSKFDNINGAMAGLIVLGYYNGLVSFCDIVPESSSDPQSETLVGYPAERLQTLLNNMRIRYPKSHLWLLEEARMHSSNRQLEAALILLSGPTRSPLKQVEAISIFEKSLTSMYTHRYTICAESFLECCQLNNWSHALYYYVAGCAHIELYRRAKSENNSSVANEHAEHCEELFKKVRIHAGKKRFMARQLPFDTFVVRKLSKWEARSKEQNVPLVDAVGVSPIEEMIYFWNGYRRMNEKELRDSLAILTWNDSPRNSRWKRECVDEQAILVILRAAIYRNLQQYEHAKALLQKEVIVHDRTLFKGGLKDDWTCVTAHYEMGANLWLQTMGLGNTSTAREMIKEAEGWLEKAAKWEAYELDARMGIKITTGLDTIRKWRAAHGQ